MEVRLITATGAALRPLEDLARLLGSGTGFVWLDIGEWDDAAEHVLTDTFRFNPMAIRDCSQRNQVPKVHVYADHVFVVLHAPQAGKAGHVHYIELDQFIGTNYLVTVHGPVNPAVDPTATRVEVDTVLHRLDTGRMHPATPAGPVVRGGVGADRPAADVHRDADQGRLAAGTTSDRRTSR